MFVELLFGTIVFLVLLMTITLVFQHMSNTRSRPKSLARPRISYPDPVPEPSPTDVVQGVNTGLMNRHIHNEDAAIDTALMGHSRFVSQINQNELSVPTLGMYAGVSNVEGGRLASHS